MDTGPLSGIAGHNAALRALSDQFRTAAAKADETGQSLRKVHPDDRRRPARRAARRRGPDVAAIQKRLRTLKPSAREVFAIRPVQIETRNGVTTVHTVRWPALATQDAVNGYLYSRLKAQGVRP